MPVEHDQHDGPAVYQQPFSAVVAQLKTDARLGLGESEAQQRLALYGRNELASEKSMPAWRRFLAQLQDVLVVLLLIATAMLKEVPDETTPLQKELDRVGKLLGVVEALPA